MTKSKVTYIKELSELKNGVREDNTTWTLWLVTDADNDRYTTFEPMLLGKAMENGTEVELTFTEEPSGKLSKAGKPLMNRSIEKVKVAQSVPAEIVKQLAELTKQVARHHEALKRNNMLDEIIPLD